MPTRDATLLKEREEETGMGKPRRAEKRDSTGSTPAEKQVVSEYIKFYDKKEDLLDPRLSLDAIRKALPAEVFVKSLRRSLQWLLWDMGIVFSLLYFTKLYVWKDAGWDQFSSHLGNYSNDTVRFFVVLPLLQMVTGFFMWCVFVAGHDCGHGSFSEYPALNLLFGLFTHGSILVPFTAWARSHRRHHLHHNHESKDYSFPWAHDQRLDSSWDTIRFLEHHRLVRSWFVPVFGFFVYLSFPQKIMGIDVGVDGNHYLPGVMPGDRLWHDASKRELAEGWLSTAVVAAYIWAFTTFLYDGSLVTFGVLYVPSWLGFCFMLFTVTYLQHHSPTTKIFDDSSYSYVHAAFETVDRTYGGIVDLLHHHISDCHVVHHLFFTKIPHYNLRKATDSLVVFLEKEGLAHLYQLDSTRDFCFRVLQYMYSTGNRATLLTTDPDGKWKGKLEKAEEKANMRKEKNKQTTFRDGFRNMIVFLKLL